MNTSLDSCPICGEGHLHPVVDKNPVEYEGQSTVLDCHYSVCDFCGSGQADPNQTRTNKRNMIAFKKTVDGLLTGQEIKALRKRLGINQSQAALLFGGGPVAFSKYENDDVMQSESMDKLLRLADAVPAAFQYLAEQAKVSISEQSKSTLEIGSYVASHWKIECDTANVIKPKGIILHRSRIQSQQKYAKVAA